MRRLLQHPGTAWAALTVYLMVGVVLPAGAVYCLQADGDVAIMLGGGCASADLCSRTDHEQVTWLADDCDSPCVDTPLTPDPTDLTRRAVRFTITALALPGFSSSILPPGPTAIESQRVHAPPSLLPVRSVVLLI
ncbi:MAG: hypothetical protein CMJ18_20120 [Phycisphaeraceae bacterium]|nr:hypothetical protein [Phycisphaeraceae bacterium]